MAVYVGEKIVLILRDKPAPSQDNGVWLATTEEHHAALRAEFPGMRSIEVLGEGVTGWQVLPADAPDFEEAALLACALIRAGDPRIGKVPGARRKRPASPRAEASAKGASKKRPASPSPPAGSRPPRSRATSAAALPADRLAPLAGPRERASVRSLTFREKAESY